MIVLSKVNMDFVQKRLLVNGMRDSVREMVAQMVGKRQVSLGYDASYKFTIVKVGNSYGVAKRCTYGKSADEAKLATGFTLALVRALGITKD